MTSDELRQLKQRVAEVLSHAKPIQRPGSDIVIRVKGNNNVIAGGDIEPVQQAPRRKKGRGK